MLFILKEKKNETFNNLSSKYLVSTDCVPGTILVIEIIIENKSDMFWSSAIKEKLLSYSENKS